MIIFITTWIPGKIIKWNQQFCLLIYRQEDLWSVDWLLHQTIPSPISLWNKANLWKLKRLKLHQRKKLKNWPRNFKKCKWRLKNKSNKRRQPNSESRLTVLKKVTGPTIVAIRARLVVKWEIRKRRNRRRRV